MSDGLKLLIAVFCNILEVLYNSLIDVARQFYGYKIPRLRVRPKTGGGIDLKFDEGTLTKTVDARIEKIDTARQNLAEAIDAIDELKSIAEENKRDLEFLTEQIQRAEENKLTVSEELQTLKGLAALDSRAVRKALMPTRVSIWTERVIAFGAGVVSSIVASYIYDFFVKPHL
jgi:hypothetical protein